MRNIELKARLADLATARRTAVRLGAAPAGVLRQTDTYFHCQRGRLKLRETAECQAQLVWYCRPDEPGAKGSDYQLLPVADPAAFKEVLSAALGLRGVVRKTRELFLLDNVRIHLDNVAGLGAFLEFEAVLESAHDDAAGHAQLARLTAEFRLSPADLLASSYSDLAGLT